MRAFRAFRGQSLPVTPGKHVAAWRALRAFRTFRGQSLPVTP